MYDFEKILSTAEIFLEQVIKNWILRSHVQISLLELYKPGHQLPQSEEVE